MATLVELAIDRATRNRGLLGRECLPDGHALILAPCSSVHTCFMRFPIDVVFVAKNGRVVKVRSDVPAWRLAGSLNAFATIELPAGTVSRFDTRRGDLLAVVPSGVSRRG
jgi:uncharacterized membrane protein (UPF0127 family)